MPQGAARRRVPILSLDVVGYVRMVEADERAALELVQTLFHARMAPSMAEAGGKIFKTMGDGLLAEFTSLVSAVAWAARL